MKYQIENRKLNNINDLIEFKNYIDSQYNREKNDLESEDKAVKESLYGEYLDVFVRTITNMMKEAISNGNGISSDLMINLSPLLGMKVNKHINENKEVFYTADDLVKAINSNKVYDKTFNAIMNQKLDSIIAFFGDVKDIDDIIIEAVEMTEKYEAKNGFTEKMKAKEDDAVKAQEEKRKASYENKKTTLATKVEANWTNEATKNETNEYKLNRLDESRKKGLAKIAKYASKSGRIVNISNPAQYSKTIGERDIDFSVIETKEELERIFLNTEIYEGSFKSVRNCLSDRIEFLNDLNDTLEEGVIKTSDVLKLGTLDLYSQMVKIREERGFFDKLFHPFQNSKEKKLINSLKQDLISKGFTDDEIHAAEADDFSISNVVDDFALKNGLDKSKDVRQCLEVNEVNNSILNKEEAISRDLNLEKKLDDSLKK